jgi:hypothetical protein
MISLKLWGLPKTLGELPGIETQKPCTSRECAGLIKVYIQLYLNRSNELNIRYFTPPRKGQKTPPKVAFQGCLERAGKEYSLVMFF